MKLLKNTNFVSPVHGRWYGDACGAAYALEVLGERWSMLIVRELMLGPRRFSQLRTELPGISAKILTERLLRLEEVAVLHRRTLPPPADTRVYELTRWGEAAEPIMLEMVRWAVRSPGHDPTLPLTPVSFMLSLRALFYPVRAETGDMTARFDFGSSRFNARMHDGALEIARADAAPQMHADIAFRARSPNACLPIFYGKQPIDAEHAPVSVDGDIQLAKRFIDLFRLPTKIG